MQRTCRRVLLTTDTVGGVWQYAMELARGLQQAGVEVTLAALGQPLSESQRADVEALPGLRVFVRQCRLEWMQEPWDDVDSSGDWLLALANTLAPDVIHLNHYSHGHLSWPAPVLMVAHSCVYSWHRWVRGQRPGPDWQQYHQRVSRGLRAADLVVAPTGAMLADAIRYYGPFRRALVIANGCRPEAFRSVAKKPRIISAGRLWDEAKNGVALSEAAPRLPWPVEIVGSNRHPDGGECVYPNVSMPGPLSRQQLAARLAESAIYALPARYEPFGLSVLEAALSGCALVLGEIPSLREVWGDSALFVPPNDRDALTAALESLCENPQLRRNYAARAGRRALNFTADRMTSAYLKQYDLLAASAQGSARARQLSAVSARR